MMRFLEEDLLRESLKYFENDLLATNIWIKKYSLKSKEEGYFEELTPDDTIKRMSKEIYRIESKYPNPLSYEEIYETLEKFKYFIFGGSILFGLGNNNTVSSLGNCFFIDNGADSYGGIFNIDECMAQLMKRRGGVGITIENLRPTGARVNNSAQSSTGAVSFMERFSNTTREVAQDGRRGALLISCDVIHPSITEFVTVKDDLKKVTGANISIKISDDFMKAAEMDQDFILRWPVENKEVIEQQIPYNKLIKLENGSYIKRIKAKQLWDTIIKQAHKNGEPGVLFWDTILKESPADCYGEYGFVTRGTNPCVTGDTLICTNKGYITIKELTEKFENIKTDIKILSFNEQNKNLEYKELDEAILTRRNTNIIEIELEDNTKIKLTPDHKVYTKNRGWIKASFLTKEDVLLEIE